MAFATWRVPRGDPHAMRFAAAPLAELVAAQRSSGISNIVAGIPASRIAAAVMRIGGPLIGGVLQRQARRAPTRAEGAAPESATTALRSRVWAEAGDADGAYVAALLETGEGYRAAAVAAVRGVELQLPGHRVGALTPVQAFGSDFALSIPGTRIEEL